MSARSLPVLSLIAILVLSACGDVDKDDTSAQGIDSAHDDTATPAIDADQDGYGEDDDCDDDNADIHPDADEICDGLDNDCDGLVDDQDDDLAATTWYPDDDLDGYGDADGGVVACEQPSGHVSDGTDCDDGNGAAYPGAPELCDGTRNDCADSGWLSDVGTVAFESDSDGSFLDLRATLGEGSHGAPIPFTLMESGTLWLCEGDWHVSLSLEADVSIVGQGEELTTLSGGGATSVVMVLRDGIGVSLSGLTLRDGYAAHPVVRGATESLAGGGLLCDGRASVTLEEVSVRTCAAEIGGGLAVTNGCELSLQSVTVSENIASDDGGGVFVDSSTVELSGSVISGNGANDDAGGVYIDNSSTSMLDVTVSENSANDDVGGMMFADSAVVLTGVVVSDNSAGGAAGGAWLYESSLSATGLTVSDNSSIGNGGGIVISGAMELSGVTITGNSGHYGGGVYAYLFGYSLDLRSAVISGNSAVDYGGGLFVGETYVELTDSILSDNAAGQGGAVYLHYHSDLQMRDTTVSGNAAASSGGGLGYDYTCRGTVTSSDFVGNDPDDVQGGYFYGKDASFSF